MINLFVRGEQLDLFKSEVFAVSKAVSKLGEFNLRHGDVSINFSIPATSKNNTIFKNISDLNNFNKNAFKRFEGYLKEDESIISSGFFQVLKIDPYNSKIEVRFYGGNSDWFDLIKQRDINGTYQLEEPNPNAKSYDLRYLNHIFNSDSIVNSWNNDGGYFYFPVDNVKNKSKGGVDFVNEDFQVGVFQHTIFKEIFDSIGVTTKGTLFNDPLYWNTLVNNPSDLSEFANIDSKKEFNTNGSYFISPTSYEPIRFNFNDNDSQWNGSTFTSNFDVPSLTFNLLLTATRGNFYVGAYGSISLKIEYTLNGVLQTPIITTLTKRDDELRDGVYNIIFNTETFIVNNLKIGDTVSFSLSNLNNTTPSFSGQWKANEYYTGSSPITRATLKYELLNANTPYDITSAIPQINQASFIKDVMFRHGVISQFDSKKRELTLNRFQDIQNNKPKAIDYSDKIDLTKSPVFDFTKVLNSFKKTSKIIYKQDDDDNLMKLFKNINNRNLGDAIININNDNITGEGVIYESEFSGTLQIVTMNDNFYLPYLPFFKPTDGGEFETQSLEPKLFVKAGNIAVNKFNALNTSINLEGVPYSTVGYAYFAKQLLTNEVIDTSLNQNLDTLAFQNYRQSTTNYIGNSLISKNYGLYFNILNNPIHLSINLDLKPLDIERVDFFKPVFLNFSLDSGYYYIDNISQYKGDGSTTTVELIKI